VDRAGEHSGRVSVSPPDVEPLLSSPLQENALFRARWDIAGFLLISFYLITIPLVNE
jgi:hypothetical protein